MPTEFLNNKFLNPSNPSHSKKSLKLIVDVASINKKEIYDQQINSKNSLPYIANNNNLSARNTKFLSNFQQSVKKHKKSDILMLKKIFQDIQAENKINDNHPKSSRYSNQIQENYQISMKDLKKLTKSTKWGSQVQFNNHSQLSSAYKQSRFTNRNRRNNSQIYQPENELQKHNLIQKRFSTPNPQLLPQRHHHININTKSDIDKNKSTLKQRFSLPVIQQSGIGIKTSQQKYQQRINNLKKSYGKAMSRRDHKNILSDMNSKQKLLDIHYLIKKKMENEMIYRQLKKQERQFTKMIQQQQKSRYQ